MGKPLDSQEPQAETKPSVAEEVIEDKPKTDTASGTDDDLAFEKTLPLIYPEEDEK